MSFTWAGRLAVLMLSCTRFLIMCPVLCLWIQSPSTSTNCFLRALVMRWREASLASRRCTMRRTWASRGPWRCLAFFPQEAGALPPLSSFMPSEFMSPKASDRVFTALLENGARISLPSFSAVAYAELAGMHDTLSSPDPRLVHIHNTDDRDVPPCSTDDSFLYPLDDTPLVVLTAGDIQPPSFVEPWTHLQNDLTCLSSRQEHVFASESDHFIPIHHPTAIIDAVQRLLRREV
eukprot:Rmarinus@m.751